MQGGEIMGNKKEKRRPTELTGMVLANTAMLEIEGDRRAVIAGCRGVLAYTEEQICLRTPGGSVAFYGQELELRCLSVDGAVIVGRLQRVEFGEEG